VEKEDRRGEIFEKKGKLLRKPSLKILLSLGKLGAEREGRVGMFSEQARKKRGYTDWHRKGENNSGINF